MPYDFEAMRFDIDAVSSADGGVKASWGRGFKWHMTPQGVSFWIAQNNKLDDAGRSALDDMVSAFERPEQRIEEDA